VDDLVKISERCLLASIQRKRFVTKRTFKTQTGTRMNCQKETTD